MTAYVTFVHELLGSLASEEVSYPGEFVDFHDVVRRYGISYSETWLDRFVTDARAFNYAVIRRQLGKVEIDSKGQPSNAPHRTLIRIASGGHEYLNRYDATAVATKIVRSPKRVHQQIKKSFDSRPRGRKSFESQLWTGRYDGSGLKKGQAEEISNLLKRIERHIAECDLSNFDKAQLQARIIAMSALIDSPKPAWRLFITMMIDFLSHPAVAASIVVIELGAKAIALAMQ